MRTDVAAAERIGAAVTLQMSYFTVPFVSTRPLTNIKPLSTA